MGRSGFERARTLASRALFALLLTGISSPSLADCGPTDRKFFIGQHLQRTPYGLADQEHPLVLCNLRAGEIVTIRAYLRAGETYFSSTQRYKLARDQLNSLTDIPVEGAYRTAEPDGYLWSMTETAAVKPEVARMLHANSGHVAIEVSTDKGGGLGPTAISRDFGLSRVVSRQIKQDGLVARVVIPNQPNPERPAVVIIGGGRTAGYSMSAASLLAARGHPVMSLPYYGLDGLPPQLAAIPIEYFARAIDLFRREYMRDHQKLVLLGLSRGTEAAALIALRRSDISGIVLFSPSAILNSAAGSTGPAWTENGAPLPFAPDVEGEADAMRSQEPPYKTWPRYAMRLQQLGEDDPARINFKHIAADVLLIACDQDDVWPSAAMSKAAEQRAKREGKSNIASHVLQGCGHDLGPPVNPTTIRVFREPSNGALYSLGGTARETWWGQKAAWSALLAYLSR